MTDYTFAECCRAADKLAKAGCLVYQKWTCTKCGERVTANTANHFTAFGHHEECGHITDIQERGCNYLCVGDVSNPAVVKALQDHMDGKK